jgi:hypothetical protein
MIQTRIVMILSMVMFLDDGYDSGSRQRVTFKMD